MKSNIRYSASALLVAGAILASLVWAEEKSAPQRPDPAADEMMKKAAAAGAPGPAHKLLEPLVGDWTAEVKMWMAPGAPPTVSKATAKSTWILKGRFVQEEFSGEFMGKPFQGLSLTGYDNVRQKYSSIWIDDMSTTMVVSEGEADAGGGVLKLAGTYACAMTGEPQKASKMIYQIVSRDKHVFEMHDPTKGDHSKQMEITYTRR